MKIIESCDVVVIGAGAAGLMCACQAAQNGRSVIVLDANRQAGRKLRLTGKGRCNLTNNCSVKEFMENIPGDGRFLYSALNRFSPDDVIAFFENAGVPLKTERGNRVFPVSDRADDIADCLLRLCTAAGVQFLKTRADSVLTEEGHVTGVHTAEGVLACTSAILCTGGLSYPLTGSDGTGYRIAKTLGHTVTELHPSLVPLVSDDWYCAEMQGFSLKNVQLSAYEDDALIFRELGEMMFTHFGVSGPLVLSASAHMRNFGQKKYRLAIDLKTGLTDEKLDEKLLREFAAASNKTIKNIMPGLIGKSLAPVILSLADVPEDTPVNLITHEQRMAIKNLMKSFPISITGTRSVDEAIITAGGVNTKEVNPRTMESKITQGLYFAGEILDVDAYTGGFNLQIAWSTGYVAGNSV